jgi:hypothetical protein
MSIKTWRTVIWVQAVVFVIVLVGVFHAPLFSGLSLLAPDTRLDTVSFEKEHFPSYVLGGWQAYNIGSPASPLAPVSHRFLLPLLSPESYRVGAYVLDTVLLFLAALFLLRGKAIDWTASLAGAMAMAFAGHSFTLIAAGHLGKFGLMPMAVFMLGCLDRAVTRRSFFYYVLAGASAAIGMFEQMDVMAMFYLLAGSYGIYKLWQQRPQHAMASYFVRQVAGLLAAGLVFLALTSSVFMTVFTVLIPSRQATVVADEDQWEFTTGWSMPPEEIVEFVAPSFFGIETGDERVPYWGRLGRSPEWEKTGAGRMNLRQHTLYLGVLSLLFAVYGLAHAWRNRNGVGKAGLPSALQEWRFWSAAWIVSVLLALGKYGLIYHVFYLIPGTSIIRGPVKFMHLVEVCTVILFSMGLGAFLKEASAGIVSKREKRAKPRIETPALVALIGVAGIAIVTLILASQRESLFRFWATRGLEGWGPVLLKNMVVSLLRTGGLLFLGAVALQIGLKKGGRMWKAPALALGITLLVALDMGTVAASYVKVGDLSTLYERNDLLTMLQASPERGRVGLLPGDSLGEMLKLSMNCNKVDFLAFEQRDDEKDFWGLLFRQPARFWQIGNAKYVFGPAKQLGGFAHNRDFVVKGSFGLMQAAGGRVKLCRTPSDSGPYLLLEYLRALPRAQTMYHWVGVATNGLASRIASVEWDPQTTVLIDGEASGGLPGSPASPVSSRFLGLTRVELETTAKTNGIVLLNDRYDKDWQVSVNGCQSPLLRCNGVMRGVRVSPGFNQVVMVYRSPFRSAALIQIVALLCLVIMLVLTAIFRLMSGRRHNLLPGAS